MLLDNHPPGPLDGLWAGVAAGGGMLALADPWNAVEGASTSGPASVPHARSHRFADAGCRPLLVALMAYNWRVPVSRMCCAECHAVGEWLGAERSAAASAASHHVPQAVQTC